MKSKRFYSLFLAIVFMLNMSASIPLDVFAEDGSHTYSYDNYTVEYAVLNEWEGNQSVKVTIYNTGTESILNWALAYRAGGEVNGLWNAVSPKENVIKNAGHNYEIKPDKSVSFGYTLSGENLELPEKIELISKRTNVADGYEVQFDVFDDWDNGFQGAVTITNTGSEPLEAWTLTFDANFTIGDYWGGRIIESTENSYTIASELWTNPIMPNSSSSFGFTAVKQADTEAAATNFVLTSVKIDENTISEEASITAEAAYDSESNAVAIVWQSTVPTGTFEVMTSLDGVNFEVAATVENVASYEYAVDSGFDAIYVKIRQNIDGNVVESNVVTVTEEDIDYELDTDEDGLPDYYEDILGTDKNNADTDGDGLSDGYEVWYLGTDPLKTDSDDNGINDGDEDFDNDGLTNAKECELGTDPSSSDTDGDGLSDGDELNTHKTDPLKYDTDGDNVSDGDEVELGLNPLNPATNGYPDNEYTTEQSLGADSAAFDYINSVENNPYTVSVDFTAAGVVENNLSVIDSRYSSAIKNSAIIGVAPEFVYRDGLLVEEATIKFKLDNSVINNTLGTYAEHNDELKGIKRLNIFTFVEGINMLLPVETFYDEATNTIYTKTNQMGTYCLIDIEIFLQNLGIEPSEDNSSDVGGDTFESVLDNEANLRYNVNAANVRASNTKYRNDFDVVFIIDEVYNTDTELEDIKEKISNLAEIIWYRSPATTITIITVDGNGISLHDVSEENLDDVLDLISVKDTTMYLDISKAIDYVADEYKNKNVYCVAFFDSNANFYSETYIDGKVKSAKATLYDIKNNGRDNINISVVSNLPEDKNEATVFSMRQRNTDELPLSKNVSDTTYFSMMTGNTGGLTFNKDVSNEDFSSDMLNHIYKKSSEDEIYIITSAGLTLLPSDFGVVSTISEQDYDKDGLLDVEEIYFDVKNSQGQNLVTIHDDGTVDLPNFYECANVKNTYVQAGMEWFVSREGFYKYNLEQCKVVPIHSAPVDADSDNDGIIDKYDENPLKYCENNDDIKDNYDNAFVTFKLDTPDEKVTIMSPSIPLMALPDKNSKTLKVINGVNGKEGKEFEVEYVTITSNDSWVRIYYNGVYGYVHNSYVKVGENNETLLKIMFSETPCIDGISFVPKWQNTNKSIEVKSKNKVVDTSISPIERQNTFEKQDVSKLAISQSELGFLYVVSKEMGDVSGINKTHNLIRKSKNMPEINNGMFEWMFAISMHESTFGNCTSPHTWKKSDATGYFQCTHWPQDDFEDMYHDKDKLSIRWSNLAMRLDKSDNDICSRKCYYGTIVIGCHCLRNSVKYSGAYETNTPEKFREKTFQYYADRKGGSKNGYNASEFANLIDEVVSIYEKRWL